MDLLNIHVLVQEFYALEAIMAMLSENQSNHLEPMRHSHSRWHSDFHDFRDEYIRRFASAIFDYTVLTVAGELRHCRRHASHYIEGYYTGAQGRNDVYKGCFEYNAHDILMAGTRLFDTDKVKWHSAFGGDKWKQIAKAGLMKGKLNDCIFIDHCVDLSHNNSIYFDKGADIFFLQSISAYQSFLDLKRSCAPQTLTQAKQGHRFNRLLWRANNLNIIEERPMDTSASYTQDEAESRLLDYRPVQWGDKRLDFSEGNIKVQEDFLMDTKRRVRSKDREYAKCA